MDAFWQWLTQPGGLISGDWTYYARGRASQAEYEHAIRTAIQNLAYASDPTAASEFYRRLRDTGAYSGDFNYYASGAAAGSEVENLISVSSGSLFTQAQTVASQPPTPTPAPPAPARPAPAPAPAPITPPTPTPAPAPPTPTPRDFRGEAAALYPWLNSNLLGIFSDLWADSGDASLALSQLRAGQKVEGGKVVADSAQTYENAFPGIRRDDGSLRMTEQEWFSNREAYGSLLTEFGLNASFFEGEGWFTRWLEGNKSPNEVAANLGAVYEGIVSNIPEVGAAYSDIYGVNPGPALFASALDPDLGQAILERRISVAQVAGEGLARGFDVDETFAGRLVSGGLDQGMARNFFVQAEGQLFTLDQLAARHRDPDDTFDLVEFAEANVFGDAVQTRRIRRLLRQEASLFTPREVGSIQTEQDFALSGLSPR